MGGEVLETYADRMIAKGREEGLLEGERRGKVEILYEMNFTIADIAEKLCISEEQVRDILEQI